MLANCEMVSFAGWPCFMPTAVIATLPCSHREPITPETPGARLRALAPSVIRPSTARYMRLPSTNTSK